MHSCKYFNGMIARVSSCVASKITLGAKPALYASSQRPAHKHHWSPGSNPTKFNSGTEVERSFPIVFEKIRNSLVMITQTVCIPTSAFEVLQKPSLKKPVIGFLQHDCRGVPKTFIFVNMINYIMAAPSSWS